MRVETIIEKAGGVRAVAEELGVTTQSIYKWQRDGYIPIKRMREVAALAGIKVSLLPIPERE